MELLYEHISVYCASASGPSHSIIIDCKHTKTKLPSYVFFGEFFRLLSETHLHTDASFCAIRAIQNLGGSHVRCIVGLAAVHRRTNDVDVVNDDQFPFNYQTITRSTECFVLSRSVSWEVSKTSNRQRNYC